MSTPHVLILGGGFGGLAAANEIRNSFSVEQVRVTIVDKKDWFMVGFTKLWIMNGTRTFEDSTVSLQNLIKYDIDFIQEEVVSIDFTTHRVHTTEQSIRYDFLLIAMGATMKPELISGLEENGLNLYDHKHLLEIRRRILGINSGQIAICITSMPYKCPPAPFEASLLVAAMLRERNIRDAVEIHIYSPAPITLPVAGDAPSAQLLDMIHAEGVIFHPSSKLQMIKPNELIFENKSANFDLLLAVPPHTAPKVIHECGLAGDLGFIKIDRDCKTAHENVFAVGDVTTMTAIDSIAVPKAGVFAEGQGLVVAKNIISSIRSQNTSQVFDGRGGCFIESGRDTAAVVQVDMFADKPKTEITESTKSNLEKKIEFELERLKWLR